MKKFIYIFLFANSLFLLPAQNVEFNKDNFPGRKEELKDVLRKLEIGTSFFAQGRKEFDEYRKQFLMNRKHYPVSLHDYRHVGEQNFRSALAPLNDANRFNPKNANLNYMLGFIWFITSSASKEALNYLEAAYSLSENPDESDVAYWLAWAYHLNCRWDDAIKYYEINLANLQKRAKANAAAIEDVTKKIAECNSGKILSANPERVFVDNLGENINTMSPEYGAVITADEETIFFTSRRPGSTGGKRDENDNNFFEDVYYSTKMGGKWQPAKQLSKNINTDTHDATSGISPDGSKLFIFRSSTTDGGDLYQSELSGAEWKPLVHLNKNVNTKYHEASASLSFDGKRLYFISDRDMGYGGGDIYYCELDSKGEWGVAKNLGPEINTKYSEEAVFMHPDGVTMYFSSKGFNTMGGYDVFKSTLVNGKWTAPVNLGFPINGPDDDVYFVVGGSGNRAYFASSKAGGFGDHDIYKITFLGPEKAPLLSTQDQLMAMQANPVSNLKVENAVKVKSAKLTILKGIIYEDGSKKPLESSIDLIDNEKNTVLVTFRSNSSTGKYLATLPSGKNYGLVVKCEGYLFHSENFNLPDSADFQEFNLDIALKKIEIGSTIVLKNIFFDSGKSTIRAESTNELARLIKLLKDNPNLKIELSSHTDNIGSDDYNMKLSTERSKSVVDYLIAHSIPSYRLIPKGYGETQPIESNNTEAGRQSNRRTEFKILEK